MSASFPFGTLQIASIINVFLFGLTFMQSYKYFRDYVEDPVLLKMIVLSTLIFSAIHTGCLEWAIYIINIVDNHANIPFLKEPPATVIGIVSGQAAQFLVQVSFQVIPVGPYSKVLTPKVLWVYRIYRLQRSVSLPIALLFPVVYVFAGGIVTACFTWDQTLGWVALFQETKEPLILSQLVAIAAIDVIIAVMLCYHLRKNRSSYLSRTIEYIDTFICKWTFQTGMITSATAIGVILAFAIRKQNGVWFCMYTCLLNLYPLTCVALLNGRSSISISTSDEVLSSVQIQGASTSAVYGGSALRSQVSKIIPSTATSASASLSSTNQDKDSNDLKFGPNPTPCW
ncbi:hypothetical protein F5887DRAFT_1281929 [Amanita rubescens]|nr:hypothetical protein F5887DRAFT_1281929 [Amanita rubescens]